MAYLKPLEILQFTFRASFWKIHIYPALRSVRTISGVYDRLPASNIHYCWVKTGIVS